MEPSETPPVNETRCPHEKDWRCQLLNKPCHPGMPGCALFGQPLIEALLAYRHKQQEAEEKEG